MKKPARFGFGAAIASGLGAALLGLAFLETTMPAWRGLFHIWMTNRDYSHGVFVPPFAAACCWQRWQAARGEEQAVVSPWALGVGLMLIVLAALMTSAGIYGRMLPLEGLAILGYLGGIALCGLGWRAIGIAGPGILFLVFMIPLPRTTGLLLAGTLQRMATTASTYVMQTLGLPAVAEGNVILLSESALGIAEACSGIRMLMSFFALTTATCLIIDRSVCEKIVVCLSAPLIAIAVNVLRITATGMAYEYGQRELAEMIFHDLAGWLMMPVGLGMIWIELQLLARIFPAATEDDEFLTLPRDSAPLGKLVGGQLSSGR